MLQRFPDLVLSPSAPLSFMHDSPLSPQAKLLTPQEQEQNAFPSSPTSPPSLSIDTSSPADLSLAPSSSSSSWRFDCRYCLFVFSRSCSRALSRLRECVPCGRRGGRLRLSDDNNGTPLGAISDELFDDVSQFKPLET